MFGPQIHAFLKCSASSSRTTTSKKTSFPQIAREVPFIFAFTQRSFLQDLQANEDHNSSLQTQNEESHTPSDRVRGSHGSRPQDPQSRRRSEEESATFSCGSKFCQSVDSKLLTQQKISQETAVNLRNFPDPEAEPQVRYTDTSIGSWKGFCRSAGDHRASTPHRPEIDGIAQRVLRGVKEVTSTGILQSG